MGEVSIRRPPSRKKARITSVQEFRAATSSPTLKVIELPSPTSGIRSPVDGIARVEIGPRCAEAVRGFRTEAAPAAPIEARSVRRLNVAMEADRETAAGTPLISTARPAETKRHGSVRYDSERARATS